MRDDLLKPVLTSESESTPSFSIRAMFFVAFFGGPLAIIIFSAISSHLMSRLGKDAVLYVAMTLISIGMLALQTASPELFEFGAAGASADDFKLIWRITGLLFMGVFYWLHKKSYRVATTFGHQYQSPWGFGILSMVLGIVLGAGVVIAMR